MSKTSKKTKGVITDAPYDKAMQAPIEDQIELTNKLCKQHDPVAESLARPTNIVDEANEHINADYPWAVPSMSATQRAILCELYRIRKALETK